MAVSRRGVDAPITPVMLVSLSGRRQRQLGSSPPPARKSLSSWPVRVSRNANGGYGSALNPWRRLLIEISSAALPALAEADEHIVRREVVPEIKSREPRAHLGGVKYDGTVMPKSGGIEISPA